MRNEKAAERDRVIYELGILLQPVELLTGQSATPAATEFRIAVAMVQAGDAKWRPSVRQLATFAPDVFFNAEFQEISHVVERLLGRLKPLLDDPKYVADLATLQVAARREVENCRRTFFELLGRVPVTWEPAVFDANTPFTSYLRIHEALSLVLNRVDYFDRYLKPEFYSLFLSLVSRRIPVRLVTTRSGVDAVKSISDLAKLEWEDYQLVQVRPDQLHDRNLRVDGQLFTLGPGVDRAGFAMTNFGPADSTPKSHDAFDALIASGVVVHGS